MWLHLHHSLSLSLVPTTECRKWDKDVFVISGGLQQCGKGHIPKSEVKYVQKNALLVIGLLAKEDTKSILRLSL